MLCREKDFSSAWYLYWVDCIANGAPLLHQEQMAVWGKVWEGMNGKGLHRKLWEWAVISQALAERGMLESGRKGIGFAVGTEPLPSLFAARGVELLVSDYMEGGWGEAAQLGSSLEQINWPGILPLCEFSELVSYQNIDMRDIAAVPKEFFDFSWSSCAIEHLGSLEAGLEFLSNSLNCLKPGGVAIHTTEFNISSNEDTLDYGDNVIYRKKDIESFAMRIRNFGCAIELLDLDPGSNQHDMAFDYSPYYKNKREHIKLRVNNYICTSLLLIIKKAE